MQNYQETGTTVTEDQLNEVTQALPDPIRRLIDLDLKKQEITAYYEELERTLAEVAALIPVNGYFKADDGTVFKIVKPAGQYVTFKEFGYERTKREGEARGSLSMKEAKDAEANGFLPLETPVAVIGK